MVSELSSNINKVSDVHILERPAGAKFVSSSSVAVGHYNLHKSVFPG